MSLASHAAPRASLSARVFLFETAYSRLYKGPQTPIPSTRLSLIPFVLLVHSEGATVACFVDIELGGSRGVSSMAAAPELFRDHGRHLRARRTKANRSVASATPGVPPVDGFDLAPQLHGDGNGDAATASAKTPLRSV